MPWRKKPAPPPASENAAAQPPGARAPVSQDEFDRALDALAGVVRAVGRYAVDTAEQKAEQIDQLAEHWSQHLLIRRPKPGDEARSGSPPRDYRGALEFVTQQRRSEQAQVVKALDDLKQTVWAFIHGLRRALAEEDIEDGKVHAQLQQLLVAAESGSTEELRRIAVSAANSVGKAIEHRRQRQSERNIEVGQHIAALGRQLEDARRQSALDSLTQLCNRRAFDDYLRQMVDLSTFVLQPNCLLLLDLDHFKRINDQYGHPAGDEVLRAFGQCLVRTFPRKDDFIARYGGEEFAIVMPDTELEDTAMLGERLRQALRKLDFPKLSGLKVTVSMGAAELCPGDDPAKWIARADRALYEAKHGGRDRLVLAHHERSGR